MSDKLKMELVNVAYERALARDLDGISQAIDVLERYILLKQLNRDTFPLTEIKDA